MDEPFNIRLPNLVRYQRRVDKGGSFYSQYAYLALSSKEVAAGKSACYVYLSYDDFAFRKECEGRTLSAFKKMLVVRTGFDRTANRHWWVGREYQGERENYFQGTRQKIWA